MLLLRKHNVANPYASSVPFIMNLFPFSVFRSSCKLKKYLHLLLYVFCTLSQSGISNDVNQFRDILGDNLCKVQTRKILDEEYRKHLLTIHEDKLNNLPIM